MLVTNLLTYVLLLVLLTVVPILPGMVMNKILAKGLAEERALRNSGQSPIPAGAN